MYYVDRLGKYMKGVRERVWGSNSDPLAISIITLVYNLYGSELSITSSDLIS